MHSGTPGISRPPTSSSSDRRWWLAFLPLLGYLVLSLALTWPLVAHFTTRVPGDGIDDPSLVWNLWWARHALVDQPQNPFACDWQFWPVGVNLAFYTLTLLNGALSIPLQLTFGVISAYNVLLLSSFVIGGYGAYLLCLEFLGRSGAGRQVDEGAHGDAGVTLSPRHPVTLSPCHRVTVSPPHLVTLAAFLGGAFYAFASAKLFYAALGQGNIASSQWIPFAALYLVRAARPAGRWRDAALAALFLALQAYAEVTFASFLLIFAGVVALWGGLGAIRARRPLAGYVLRFALVGVLVLLALAPILANMLPDLAAEGDFFSAGGGFADIFSADLAGYLAPTQLHPLLGGLVRAWSGAAAQADGSNFAVDKGQHIYVGYVALALALLGAWRGRRRPITFLWAGSALLFFVLTLGPSLRLAGHDLGLPLPFRLLEQLPFFKGNRYPSRYSVMLLLSLAPLLAGGVLRIAYCVLRTAYCIPQGGFALWRTAGRPRTTQQCEASLCDAPRTTPFLASLFPCFLSNLFPRLLVSLFPCLLVSLLLFEHLSAPLPLSDLSVPKLYERVAAEPGDFALLELPLGWRNGARVAGKQDVLIMQHLWVQTSHGKRLLGGNTSRNPEFKFQYFSEDPTLARLIAITNAADLPDQHVALRAALADQPITAADATRARAWAGFLNIRYVMVHRDKLPAEAEAALKALLPVALVAEDGPLALYRLPADRQAPQRFALGDEVGRLALAEGWSTPSAADAPVYAQRREVRLLLPLPPEQTRLRLDGWALAPDQELTLLVNGRPVGTQSLPGVRSELTYDVPADPARPPLSDVRLRFAALAPVALQVPASWPVGRSGAASPVAILARSAGQATGDFAHIYVNGVDVAPNRRGYNLAALDGATGALLQAAAFDTHAGGPAAAQLAAWIADWPPGTIIAGAVRDEASRSLSPRVGDALRSLGVGGDLSGRFRWGHAFIGVKGAPPGSALESLDGWLPTQVIVGPATSAPVWAASVLNVIIVQ